MFDKAIDRSKDEHVIFQNRGMLHIALKNYQAAEKDLSASLQINPLNLKARLYRVKLRSHCGQYSSAISDILFVIEQQPENQDAIVKLFELLLESAQYYSAASVILSTTASADSNTLNKESYLDLMFRPTAGDFFCRIAPFRSLIKFRF